MNRRIITVAVALLSAIAPATLLSGPAQAQQHPDRLAQSPQVSPEREVDFTYPLILKPVHNASGVPITTPVQARFDRDINSGGYSFTFALANSSGAVPATVSYDPSSWIASLVPTQSLTPATAYTAKVVITRGDGATDTTVWNFTTQASTAPTGLVIVEKSPSPGEGAVARYRNIVVSFDRAVTGVSASTLRVRNTRTGSYVAGQIVNWNAGYGPTNTWILDPSNLLAGRTTFEVQVVGGKGGIAGVDGTPLVTQTWRFTTAR